jgi:hypothetical protein
VAAQVQAARLGTEPVQPNPRRARMLTITVISPADWRRHADPRPARSERQERGRVPDLDRRVVDERQERGGGA